MAVLSLFAFGSDVFVPIQGARYLATGVNPYAVRYSAIEQYAYQYYPLHALLLCLPVAWLPDRLAACIVAGVCLGVYVYAAYPTPRHFLMLLSAPAILAWYYAQPWPFLVAAAWLVPGLVPVAALKPNLAAPLVLARPSGRLWLWVVSLALFGASIALGWLAHLGSHESQAAIATPVGALAALAVLRYRDARARLVLFSALMPLRVYDPLWLWSVPRTWHGCALLSAASWLLFLIDTAPYPRMVWLVGLAALLTYDGVITRSSITRPLYPPT